MPSYQYTRDIKPEDLKPEKPPELVGKEKAKNWWHYHRVWVLVGAVAAVVLAFLIYDMATKVQPDYRIGVLSPVNFPDALTQKLEEGFAAYVDDRNGDGKVEVLVELFTVGETDTPQTEDDLAAQMQDPYAQMAGVVRLTAAMDEGEPIIFLMEPKNAAQYQRAYQLFGTAEGGIAPAEVPVEELSKPFAQIPGLAGMSLNMELFEDGQTVDGHPMLDGYLVGLRPYYGTKLEDKNNGAELWAYTQQLWARLQ